MVPLAGRKRAMPAARAAAQCRAVNLHRFASSSTALCSLYLVTKPRLLVPQQAFTRRSCPLRVRKYSVPPALPSPKPALPSVLCTMSDGDRSEAFNPRHNAAEPRRRCVQRRCTAAEVGVLLSTSLRHGAALLLSSAFIITSRILRRVSQAHTRFRCPCRPGRRHKHLAS